MTTKTSNNGNIFYLKKCQAKLPSLNEFQQMLAHVELYSYLFQSGKKLRERFDNKSTNKPIFMLT